MADPPPFKPLRASLVSLDHAGDSRAPLATQSAENAFHETFDLVGLDGDSAGDALELSVDEREPAFAVQPESSAVNPFAAPTVQAFHMELDHPVPVPPSPAAPPLADDGPLLPESEPEEFVFEPIPGRIAQGALRRNPALRLALGLAVGLLVGYIASAPYARRVERHVAALRSDANVDRYRPLEEAHQNAARLDSDADDRATSGAFAVGAIWLVLGGAAVLVWYRFT